MEQIRIYTIVDPLTGDPFYVGATKYMVKYRAKGHISDAVNNVCLTGTKAELRRKIRSIISKHMKPVFIELFSVDATEAGDAEEAVHILFSLAGFRLMQCGNEYSFYTNNNLAKYRVMPKKGADYPTTVI